MEDFVLICPGFQDRGDGGRIVRDPVQIFRHRHTGKAYAGLLGSNWAEEVDLSDVIIDPKYAALLT